MSNINRNMIAVVDDDEDARKALNFLLDALGRSAEGFSSGADLLNAELENFDHIILDQHMPRMTGLQLMSILRSSQINTPVMLMSGNLTDEVVAAAEALGAKVTEKPLSLEVLAAFLDKEEM
ncbi:response regulator (plasmid) [Mesorhizobium sp. AR02]|uniref:response regulator n=1 Tax=unclassified Mesorhizobium TaxID=325217 RepID=UPI00215F33F4|nr:MULTISPECIES: response regulator [unclassified Mesorhizobium]UVK35537.1 response regulator [Mesorhizobium sp. AR10]UVK50135.1 response regulator [Mesorhizobium sp. AR02]